MKEKITKNEQTKWLVLEFRMQVKISNYSAPLPGKRNFKEFPVVHDTSHLYFCFPEILKRCLPLPNISLTFGQWTELHSQPRDWIIPVLSEYKEQPKAAAADGHNAPAAQTHAAENHRPWNGRARGTRSKEHPREQVSAVFCFSET